MRESQPRVVPAQRLSLWADQYFLVTDPQFWTCRLLLMFVLIIAYLKQKDTPF